MNNKNKNKNQRSTAKTKQNNKAYRVQHKRTTFDQQLGVQTIALASERHAAVHLVEHVRVERRAALALGCVGAARAARHGAAALATIVYECEQFAWFVAFAAYRQRSVVHTRQLLCHVDCSQSCCFVTTFAYISSSHQFCFFEKKNFVLKFFIFFFIVHRSPIQT